MKQVLTLVVKLQVDINQQQLLVDTANAFASACNWINQNVNPNLTNRNSIQAFCYKDVTIIEVNLKDENQPRLKFVCTAMVSGTSIFN